VSLRARVRETESGVSQERTTRRGKRGGGQRQLPMLASFRSPHGPLFTRRRSHLASARSELRQRVWLQYIY
jgi:hypothetical protein